MSGHRVYLIGIGPGCGIDLLTVRALRSVDAASRVYYTGLRLDDELRVRFGAKLVTPTKWDEETLFEDVLVHWRSGGSPAVLFSGDGAFYSGDPGVSLPESKWAARLAREAVPFEHAPGLSSIHLALRAAGWSLPTESGAGLVIAAPFLECDDPSAELHRLASMDRLLVLVQSVCFLETIVDIVMQHRGGDTPMIVARSIGWPDETVVRTTLRHASDDAMRFDEPAIVMIAASVVPELPSDFLDHVSLWLARHGSDRVSWLAGPPGAGKSTIARAVERLDPRVRADRARCARAAPAGARSNARRADGQGSHGRRNPGSGAPLERPLGRRQCRRRAVPL